MLICSTKSCSLPADLSYLRYDRSRSPSNYREEAHGGTSNCATAYTGAGSLAAHRNGGQLHNSENTRTMEASGTTRKRKASAPSGKRPHTMPQLPVDVRGCRALSNPRVRNAAADSETARSLKSGACLVCCVPLWLFIPAQTQIFANCIYRLLK